MFRPKNGHMPESAAEFADQGWRNDPRGIAPAALAAYAWAAYGTTAPAELTITEATASEDVVLIRATTRIDRYAHGLTRAKGIAGRHLAMEITARATRS